MIRQKFWCDAYLLACKYRLDNKSVFTPSPDHDNCLEFADGALRCFDRRFRESSNDSSAIDDSEKCHGMSPNQIRRLLRPRYQRYWKEIANACFDNLIETGPGNGIPYDRKAIVQQCKTDGIISDRTSWIDTTFYTKVANEIARVNDFPWYKNNA